MDKLTEITVHFQAALDKMVAMHMTALLTDGIIIVKDGERIAPEDFYFTPPEQPSQPE